MRALGQLLRLSLAPSALADVAAGVVFASAGFWPSGAGPFWLMASSACVYHGALALNDWHDREHDRRTRPSRPIPSGAISPPLALAIGVGLLLAGPCLALQHSQGAALWSLGLVALASLYDLVGRGPRLGPLLLALCRSGNLGLGLFFAGGAFASGLSPRAAAVPMILYAVYVLRVSQLGRFEDGEAEESERPSGRPAGLVASAATMLALVPLLPPYDNALIDPRARILAALLTWPAALGLARQVMSLQSWTRATVERAMGLALRRLLIFSAALAALSWRAPALDALFVSAAILCGYLISAQLRRVFPPS